MKTHPGRALYTIARYWRSMGIQHLALTLPEEELPSPQELARERETQLKALGFEIESQGDHQAVVKSVDQSVIAEGNTLSPLMFVTAPPGRDGEVEEKPLQGEVGELFDRMIQKMGFQRSDIFIASISKGVKPADVDEKEEEFERAYAWLDKALDLISPKVIVTLGSVATKTLLHYEAPITKLRGQFHPWKKAEVMPTYHPAYLLKKNSAKKDVWMDMLAVLEKLNSLNVKVYASAQN